LEDFLPQRFRLVFSLSLIAKCFAATLLAGFLSGFDWKIFCCSTFGWVLVSVGLEDILLQQFSVHSCLIWTGSFFAAALLATLFSKFPWKMFCCSTFGWTLV